MIYGIFLIVWAAIFLFVLAQAKFDGDLADEEVSFDSPFYQGMYRISFAIPFKWFVEDDRNLTKKGKRMNEMLIQSGYNKKFTVRSFMAYKVVVMFASVVLILFTLLLLDNMTWILSNLLNIDTSTMDNEGLTMNMIIFTTAFYLVLSLFPGIKLSNKAKKEIVNANRDLPILHMFTILLLRSNKTVSEILFALSKLNTYHKEVFERGYRMHLRNKHEGMAYLRSQFENERFVEMFSLLEDIAEYAREECIAIMDSNMNKLVEDINTLKRRNDLSRLVYSQASMVVPFLAIILLGAAPLVMAGLKIFSLSTVM